MDCDRGREGGRMKRIYIYRCGGGVGGNLEGRRRRRREVLITAL